MNLFLIKHKLKNDFPLMREVTWAHPQRAAVMVMLYPKHNKTHVLMTKRAEHLKYHAGEVSFPGGVFEDDRDDDLLATALRETQEELAIGIEPEDVLGKLPVVNTRLGFEITPFVSILAYSPKYQPSENEVGEVLEIPFTTLLSTQQRDVGNKTGEVMYWFRHHRIWGASAKILSRIGHLATY
ncbi:MAG: coenzyme A pyrophosphatase [Nitrospinae bacterium CG22_combo_CG10-13_8_21_14_all_47_10]|nr:MAG: coenzyme A pyrophosphatase [Nitrospinae bacterium CG22_combo_CG10-13_8_21_14_all_47_10]